MWVLIICVNIYNSKHALNIFSEKVLFNLIFLNYYFKQKPLTLVSGSSSPIDKQVLLRSVFSNTCFLFTFVALKYDYFRCFSSINN